MKKTFIDPSDLLDDSSRLAEKILESGFEPDFIVGIWRGGAPVGIAVQELLSLLGISSDHIAIRTSSYTGIDERHAEIAVHGLGYISERITKESSLLIVDDVFDTGLSMAAVLKEIASHCGERTPKTIGTATVYYKPKRARVEFEPDFFIHQTEDWLIFPHELEGLTMQEIADEKSPVIARILARYNTNDHSK